LKRSSKFELIYVFQLLKQLLNLSQVGLKQGLPLNQGDQIGRFFFGQFMQNFRNSPNFWAAVFHGKSSILILAKCGLGYILGDYLQTHLVTLPSTQFFKKCPLLLTDKIASEVRH
jgi:hypothetical protein